MKLTPKQLTFAESVIAGKDQCEAYRLAYDCTHSSPMTVATNAHRTAALPHVAAHIAAERETLAAKGVMSRVWTLELLREIAEDRADPSRTGDRIRALRLSAELQGYLLHRQELAVGVAAGSMDLVAWLLKDVRSRSTPYSQVRAKRLYFSRKRPPKIPAQAGSL